VKPRERFAANLRKAREDADLSQKALSHKCGWPADALVQLSKGAMRAPKPTTVREAWEAWLDAARAGTVRNRSGERYTTSTLRSYKTAMRRRVLPELGAARLADISQGDLQDFLERTMAAEKLSAAAVNVTIAPCGRCVCVPSRAGSCSSTLRGTPHAYSRRPARALRHPGRGRVLDRGRTGGQPRPVGHGAVRGLRRGELMALRWENVDLAADLIHVRKGWDPRTGKSGSRRAPGGGASRSSPRCATT
jgi:integrase